ncbi:MAG TPA: ABC transporter ATP-binding protein [Phycisphaerae bacterium]|nr:ABC transporter ATP-binding protein [Phycisphaerae bacterium]HOJ75507.1 ABC transporter ATP-binding protein [Phycisphaerae bacterium]HOM52857.1 ABC transporter ATP-binding protein [Phycisphaerae bacterium]HON67114.1 ABC transporter ATP-binding protein [Phycisphaerae bacterium]HOQ86882.1 ABC transporter ATP-binding protein [Phycisphaerae bacterium]
MNAAIDIQQVTKRYGNFTAVDGLSLQVAPGELFAFLGPNGAGKTTTIKMISGLLMPDMGTVHLCGYPMGRDGRKAKAQLAYVPDEPFLYEKLSGREFLEFVAEMYALPPDVKRRRMEALVDRLELGAFWDKLCEGYSHGMKQRTVLAAAMLHEPRVLVIDEPMVGLDPKTVRTVKDLMRELVRQGGTVFMSTHTLEIAEAVADRIGIIHHGKLVAVGTAAEIKASAPQNSTLEDVFLKLTNEAEPAPASDALAS